MLLYTNATFSSKVLYLFFCLIKTTNLSIKQITFAVMFRQKDLLSVDTTEMEFFVRNEFELHIIPPKYNPCIQTFCIVGGITSVICLSFKDF